MSADSSQAIADVPFISQIDQSDCGAACVSMVCQYFKKNLHLSTSRQLCGIDASGQKLSEILQNHGIHAPFLKKDFATLLNEKMPIIAHWHGNHWVVICGIKNGKVKINDPASGCYWLSSKEALEKFSGYALVIKSFETSDHKISPGENHLAEYLKPFRYALILSTVCMMPIIATEISLPLLCQKIIDENFLENEQTVKWLIIFSSITAIVVICCFATLNIILFNGAVRSEKKLLGRILNCWLNFPEHYYKQRSFAELRTRLESLFEIKYFLVNGAGNALFAILEIIALFAMLEFYNFALNFAVLLIPALCLTFFTFYLTKNNTGLLKYSRATFHSALDDLTQGVFSIRQADATEKFKKFQHQMKEEMYAKVFPLERKILICEKGAQALAISSIILLFFQLCPKYFNGEITTGTLFAILCLAALILNALTRIVSKRTQFEHATIIYEYLNDMLDHHPQNLQPAILTKPATLKITDNFDNQFTLQTGEKALITGIDKDLIINHLQGKTSSPYQISLQIEETTFENFENLPQLSYIHQYEHIFNQSISENISLGSPDDTSRINWFIRLSLADQFVNSLPHGIHSKIDPSSTSSNETKKILLARTLYRDRPLYILQNLSSFLTPTELLTFIYHLKVHLPDKTILIDDPSPFFAESFEKIIKLEAGRIRHAK